MKKISGGVCAAKGFLASGIYSGIRRNPNKMDLALIYSDVMCDAAAVYTQNKTKAAPLYVTHKHMQSKKAQAIICNSGNANACTANGEQKAQDMCEMTAVALGLNANDVLVASTGIIGVEMSTDPIKNGMSSLVSKLSVSGSEDSANAIMTTDLSKKEISFNSEIGGKSVSIGGIAKGSGMIHPNMATMLCFVTTDVKIEQNLLQKALADVISDTFNMVSVDGDTSTNDMVLLLANGKAENVLIDDENSDGYKLFYDMLFAVCKYLATEVARDGEGASKLLTCMLSGANEKDQARKLAKAVITSSLFKAAMFGEDANWGRIICALGYAETEFEPKKTKIGFKSEFGEIVVCKDGEGLGFDEKLAAKILSSKEVVVDISVGNGTETATAWGCDLTYDYIKINGDYRS